MYSSARWPVIMLFVLAACSGGNSSANRSREIEDLNNIYNMVLSIREYNYTYINPCGHSEDSFVTLRLSSQGLAEDQFQVACDSMRIAKEMINSHFIDSPERETIVAIYDLMSLSGINHINTSGDCVNMFGDGFMIARDSTRCLHGVNYINLGGGWFESEVGGALD